MPKTRSSTRVRNQQDGVQFGFEYFLPFPRLPIELRIAIWTLSLPGSQIQGPHLSGLHWKDGRDPLSKNPATPQVNREARSVALSLYTARDPRFLAYWQAGHKAPYPSYVDFKNDTFVFPNSLFFKGPPPGSLAIGENGELTEEEPINHQFFSRKEMAQIVNLRLETYKFEKAEVDILRWIEDWLPYFTRLKEFKLVPVFCTTIGRPPPTTYWWKPHPMQNAPIKIYERLLHLNQVLRKTMEDFEKKRLQEGVVWNMPRFKVVERILEMPLRGRPRTKCTARRGDEAEREMIAATTFWQT